MEKFSIVHMQHVVGDYYLPKLMLIETDNLDQWLRDFDGDVQMILVGWVTEVKF